jgi:hypothetical protein
LGLKHIIYIFIPLILSAALSLLKVRSPVAALALSLGFLIFWGFAGAAFYYEYPFRAAVTGNAFLIIGMAVFVANKVFDTSFLGKLYFIKNISSNLLCALVLFKNAFFKDSLFEISEYICFAIILTVFCVGRSIGFNLSIKNKYTLDKRLFKN